MAKSTPKRATTIRRFGIMSSGKMWGSMGALLGLIVGVAFLAVSLLGGAMMGGGLGMGIGGFVGISALIFLPLVYGVAGFVGGVLSAALYNVVASKFGGIEVELS